MNETPVGTFTVTGVLAATGKLTEPELLLVLTSPPPDTTTVFDKEDGAFAAKFTRAITIGAPNDAGIAVVRTQLRNVDVEFEQSQSGLVSVSCNVSPVGIWLLIE